jgi:hypothetical protein
MVDSTPWPNASVTETGTQLGMTNFSEKLRAFISLVMVDRMHRADVSAKPLN